MGRTRQINIKNRTNYFYNDRNNLKDFDASLLKVDKKRLQRDWYLLHLKKLLITTILTLYLMIDEMIGHFEEKNRNKYLVLDDVDENKEVSKKYEEV